MEASKSKEPDIPTKKTEPAPIVVQAPGANRTLLRGVQTEIMQENGQIIVPRVRKFKRYEELTFDTIGLPPYIYELARCEDWLYARKMTKSSGGLPSNALHDRYINSRAYITLIEGYYPAWSREILAYPEKDGVFKKGQDVKDARRDANEREWILPASCMPEEAVNIKGVGLFIDPKKVEVSWKRVAILSDPKAITILTPFMQSKGWGKVDETTKVPLAVQQELLPQYDYRNRWLDLANSGPDFIKVPDLSLHDHLQGYIWRGEGAGVRPFVRHKNTWWENFDKIIYANVPVCFNYGVANMLPVQMENLGFIQKLLRCLRTDKVG